MNHITIKGWYVGKLVEVEVLKDTSEGYQLGGGLVRIEDLRQYVRQNSPAFVYRNGRVYRRE